MPARREASGLANVTVVAVDWSGAVSPAAQRRGVCAAVWRNGSVTATAGRTRDETVAFVMELPAPVVVGFDFSFALPAWFARELGCRTIADVWEAASTDGEKWLREPMWPFWGHGARPTCDVEPARRFRACEQRLRDTGRPAKSVFQLVGNGQVGAGSVRGMPFLSRLRDAGFAVWPFDGAGERTVVEIYPNDLRRSVPPPAHAYASEHERDAVDSVRVMARHVDDLMALTRATSRVTHLEGDVWRPPPHEPA
jgi:hypothetical protein